MKRISINILFLILSGGLASAQSFVSPIDNRQVTQPYANYGFVPGKYHTGMDINRQGIDPYSQRTEKVKAARAGTVHKIFGLYITGNNLRRWNPSTGTYTWEPAPPGDNHGLGICVIIYHPDLKLYTLYGHLDAVVTGLNVGNNVSAGQVIGLLGNSYKQFLRRCRNDDGHDHQALCVNTAPDAPLGTITKDSDGFRPHVHFETKDRGVLSTRRTDDEGPDWGYTPGPAPSTPNMPGHPNWFGYHDPNIFLNLSVQMLTEPVPIEILQSPLNVRSYPSTSPPSDSLNYVITSISQRSDGNLPAFVTMRSVGSQWYQIYLPNAETEGWSASGWIAGTLDSTYSKTNATLPQVKVIKDSAWVRTQPQSGSQTLALVYGENQQDPQRFVPFDTTTGWYRIYLPVKSPQPDGWISSSDVQFIGTATRTLTVASANPNSGVSITVSPNDNNGQGNGTTQFTRTYNNNTSVTLTAPSTAQSNTFQKWQRNGVDYVPSQSITVTMDADYTLTAVYVTPTVTRTLTVASSNPNSGVSITVSPNDNNGQGNGTTQFTRVYNNNAVVTLTAPSTAQSNTFQKWQRNGADFSINQSINVTMDANYTLTAVYVTPTVTRTLTVASSNPNSGVSITVSPNDNNGQGNGTTQFTRVYNNNTSVTLTAPSTAQNNTFQKWQHNGVDFSTNPSISVTMDANYTLTAVYVTQPTQLPPSIFASFHSDVTPNSATLNGNVNPNGLSTTAWFEWGPTPAYGNATPSSDLGTGTSIVSYNQTLSGLSPNTTYYYRAVAQNSFGTSKEVQRTFTTATPSDSFTEIPTGLIGAYNSSVAWGDYDNDGDLDILLTGWPNGPDVSKVYRNDNGNFVDISASLIGVEMSSVAWGDYDNDGDLDILLTGAPQSGDYISKIYRNDNGNFVDISVSLTGVAQGSVAWGDYDNDGDLDILLTGHSGSDWISKIYRNNVGTANTVPTPPTNLTSSVSGNSVTLSWNKSTDLETFQNGLTYNLGVGTTSGGAQIVSPMASAATGYRKVPQLGNTNHRNSWTIKNLPDGTYYWSVQAIDSAFAGSAFAAERSFVIQRTAPDIAVTPTPGDYGNVTVGATSDKTFTVSNPGTATLNVTSTTLTGTDASQFSIQSGGGSFSLNPGQTRNIVVRFAPTSTGNKSATLSLANNVTGKNPFNVSLSGMGTDISPVPIFPTSVNAGIVNKGVSSTATFTVKNTGGGTLSVTGLTSSNSQFTASPTNFNLTAGASQTVTVAFMPTRVGWEQSTLTITHNAQGSPATVTANGIGRMTPPTGNLDNTKIAFDSNRDGNGEVYVMNADGTNLVNRTNHPGTDGCPSWSPDGTKVAFESDRDSGTFDIYLMNADGTNLINLTNIAGHDVQPVWSPDGTKIAFRSLRDGGQGEVYVMNANGTNPVNLTHNGAEDSKPAWSPDGTKIAFASFREGNGEIYVMNADGSNPTRLTNHPAVDVTPAWSPDGTQIAFTSNRDGNYEVYVMNADGTNQTRLTNQAGENIDIDLSWSPDGTKIAFVLWRGGNGEIYVMNANGSNLIKLTDNPAADRHPSWSPFLQPPLPPVVSSLNPTYGSVGTSVTIIGEHFGASQNGSTVTFSGVQATSITSWSDIQIVAVVPVNATKGPVVVTVNGRAGNSDKVFTPNTPPVANPQSVTTAEDTALSITLTGSDADKDPLTFTVMMQPANGTLTGTAPNLTYTPNLNFNGSDSFTFKANDGKADSESATVSITVTQINDPPVFDAITNQTVLEDASATTLTVTGIGPGGGADESSQTVALTVAGSNPAIVPDPTFSGSGATRTLTFQPVANANGTATITMTVTDNGPTGAPHVNTFSREFTLTVTPVNDAPSFTKGANQTVLEDVGAQTVKNWATAMKPGPDDEKVQVLTFTVTSSNAALFSTQPLIDPTTGDLTYTPVKDANGTATVSVVLKDNGGTANGGKESSATETFTITMTPVNDAPVFDAIVNQTVLEDVAATPIQMTGIGPGGGADEASQTVALTVASSDPTIVPDPTLSGSGATRTLTFQPVANANGVVTITVTAKDNGGTANGGQDTFSRTFTVTVTSVNDPPTFDPIADQKVFEDAGATSIPINNIGPGGGSDELGQLVTLTATSSDPSIVPNPTIVGSGATRTLTFTPVAREGAVTITVKATDNGPASTPHVNTFERKFTITVAQGPVLSIAAPTANQILPAGTTSTTLAVNIQNHTGAWHWKLNDPFPTSGPAGGNRVASGNTITLTGLQNGKTYTVYVTLVDGNGNILSPPGSKSVTFSVAASPPTLSITTPTANQILPAGTTSTTLTVAIQNHTGAWHWKLNDPFLTSGPAGGNRVASGNTVTLTGLQNGKTYTAYATLVDANGNMLSPPVTASANFSVHADETITSVLVVEGVIRNPDGSPAEAGLNVTVTVGGNLSQNTSTRADGSYTVTFLDLLGIVAKIGDAVTVSVSRAMTGESAVGMVILTSQQLIDQTATVGVIFSGKAIFDLTIPQGISLIHIPLKVAEVDGNALEIKTIGDLYAVLGGSANVNFIITRDTAAGIWQSYLGEQNRRAPADRTLTDDLGIITVMKNPVTLRLKGDALGVDGKAQIHLQKGTNLVGVPLKSASLKRVSDLFSLTGIKDNATSIIVSDAGQFKVVSRPGDPGDITLIGGQSFLVTARQVGVADITGVAWDNVSSPASAAPPMAFVGHNVDESTPVLAVYGAVVEEFTGLAKEGFRVIAKNLSTGASISTPSGGDTPGGSYNVTVVDFRLGRAAQVGDTLEITVDTGNPLIGVQPLRHIVSPDDAKASQIQLPDLVAYRIPTETKLLPNYPNPFNPETWIPYRLARDASVTLTIYDTTGAVVQTLQVGHKPAAAYESKGKAIYWDGRNHFGERVASGVYFYTLTANDFTATRKMLILK